MGGLAAAAALAARGAAGHGARERPSSRRQDAGGRGRGEGHRRRTHRPDDAVGVRADSSKTLAPSLSDAVGLTSHRQACAARLEERGAARPFLRHRTQRRRDRTCSPGPARRRLPAFLRARPIHLRDASRPLHLRPAAGAGRARGAPGPRATTRPDFSIRPSRLSGVRSRTISPIRVCVSCSAGTRPIAARRRSSRRRR